jgi:hypothetical protein
MPSIFYLLWLFLWSSLTFCPAVLLCMPPTWLGLQACTTHLAQAGLKFWSS